MSSPLAAPRLMVIDDHEAHCEGLAELLALKGFETRCATTGMQGLQLVAVWKPDAVLTDLNLPDLKGSELCRRIRANPDWDTKAVIIHTGSELHPRYGSHCDAFLTYPIETRDLVATLTGCMMRRQRSHTQNGSES